MDSGAGGGWGTRALGRGLLATVVFLLAAEGALRAVLALDRRGRLHTLGWRTQRAAVVMVGVVAGGGGFHALPRMAHDPDLGWTPLPGQVVEDGVVYTVDADHRRVTGPADAASGRPRIVLLGDSFTFGDEVSDDETWAWALREETGAEVHNLGALGYGLDQVLLRWRRDGVQLAPDVVVIGHLDLMHHRTGVPFSSWAKPWFIERGGALVLQGTPVPDPETLLRTQVWRPMLAAALVDAAGRLTEPADADPMTPVLGVSARLLETLVEEVEASGATVVLAHFVHESDFVGEPEDTPSGRRVFEEACRYFDLVCVDTRPALEAARSEGVSLYRRAHWSPEGNAVVAEVIVDGLRGAGLVSGEAP